MKVSLFIIVLILYSYTTWVQKTARNVIAETAAREALLMERLGCSEKARILAESALAAARKTSPARGAWMSRWVPFHRDSIHFP